MSDGLLSQEQLKEVVSNARSSRAVSDIAWASEQFDKLLSHIAALELQKIQLCRDWAYDHTHLQKLCREAGVSEQEVEGNSYGIPDISDLADKLWTALQGDRSRLDWLREIGNVELGPDTIAGSGVRYYISFPAKSGAIDIRQAIDEAKGTQ